MNEKQHAEQIPQQQGHETSVNSQENAEKNNFVPQHNPLLSPANFEKAVKHARATRVAIAREEENVTEFCEDCGLPTENNLIPVCGTRLDLKQLGAGFPLYYEYIVFVGILLLLMFAIVGIGGMVMNKKGTACEYNFLIGDNCDTSFMYKYSLGNKSPADDTKPQDILNVIFVVLGLLISYYYRKVQNATAEEVNRGAITPADYTIMVSNIPKGETKKDIAEFFIKKGSKYKNKKLKIKKVSLSYNISIYINLTKKKEKLIARKSKNANDQVVINELKDVEEKIKKFEETISTNESAYFTGIAFVTFNTQQEAIDVIENFNLSIIEKLAVYSFKNCLSYFGTEFPSTYKGNVLIVERAPEPFDVIWENLGVDLWEIISHRLATAFGSLLLIGCCFGAILGINYGKKYLAQQISEGYVLSLVSLASSVIVIIINGCLNFFCRILVRYEKHKTQTDYVTTVADRLSYSQFFNTALVILIVQKITQEDIQLWTKDSMVSQVFFLFIFTSFLPPIMRYFNIFYIIRRLKQLCISKKNSKLNQYQANLLFEGPQLDLAINYTSIQKLVLFTGFYATMVPIGIVFASVGCFVAYWIDKYLLVRRYSRPISLGEKLPMEMTDFLELFFVAFTSGNVIFQKIVYDKISPIAIATLIFAVVIWILPQNLLAKCIITRDDSNSNPKAYGDVRKFFLTEYDRVNPVTQEEAMKEWLESLAETNKSTPPETQTAKDPNNSMQPIYPNEQKSPVFVQNGPKRTFQQNLNHYMQDQAMFQQIRYFNPRVNLPQNFHNQGSFVQNNFSAVPTFNQFIQSAQNNLPNFARLNSFHNQPFYNRFTPNQSMMKPNPQYHNQNHFPQQNPFNAGARVVPINQPLPNIISVRGPNVNINFSSNQMMPQSQPQIQPQQYNPQPNMPNPAHNNITPMIHHLPPIQQPQNIPMQPISQNNFAPINPQPINVTINSGFNNNGSMQPQVGMMQVNQNNIGVPNNQFGPHNGGMVSPNNTSFNQQNQFSNGGMVNPNVRGIIQQGPGLNNVGMMGMMPQNNMPNNNQFGNPNGGFNHQVQFNNGGVMNANNGFNQQGPYNPGGMMNPNRNW